MKSTIDSPIRNFGFNQGESQRFIRAAARGFGAAITSAEVAIGKFTFNILCSTLQMSESGLSGF
jgi:hypothetical protein